ncbi:MAG: hypothetical protein HY244_15170 [Rhizobiales bacterium]|nr:hypothetical protein [Hyphomicrobiales bacterium]
MRKSSRTQFSPPISPGSIEFHQYGWDLFGKYLAYVVAQVGGTHWNPVAYHLYNACEATALSVDAWAVGISVAVEAVVGLISIEGSKEKAGRVADFQKLMRKWLEKQSAFSDLFGRVRGLIETMSNRRPQDTLYALAETGHVEKDYIEA